MSFIFYSTLSVPYVKGNCGVTTIIQESRDKDSLSISLADHTSTLSFSMESTLNQDFVTLQDSDSDTVSFYTAKSFNDPRVEDQCQQGPLPGLGAPTINPLSVPPAPPPVFFPTTRPASVLSTRPQAFLPIFCPVSAPSATTLEIPPTLRPASVPPHLLGASESTIPVHGSSGAETV